MKSPGSKRYGVSTDVLPLGSLLPNLGKLGKCVNQEDGKSERSVVQKMLAHVKM